MEPQIFFENENYVVLNKPTGFLVHPAKKPDEKSICDWVKEKYPQSEKVGGTFELQSGVIVPRFGIAHRLDRETSGALVIAKNERAFAFLKDQFLKKEVKKKYYAFVYGRIHENEGYVDLPIGRSKKDFRMWATGKQARGVLREAFTEYKTIFTDKEFTFLELLPKTGRTHQIRVHLKSINHPVVCDKLYAPNNKAILGFNRLALHCFFIEFEDVSGQPIGVSVPYPDDFKNALEFSGMSKKTESMLLK